MADESKTAAAKGLVIVTGASSGIGAAVAKSFSAAGHPVLLLSRRTAEMEALGLPNSMCLSVDVSSSTAFTEAVAKGEEKFGPAVGIVNNAGCMLLSGSLEKQEESEWDRMFNVNVKGVMNGMKAVLGGMKERKKGTIINISSIAGIAVFDNHAVYCATKFAVQALCEAVRQECCATGVRVISVCPGVVETPLLSHTTDEEVVAGYKGWKEGQLKGEALHPEDIAGICLFAFQQPAHVCMRNIVVGPTFQKP